MNTKEIALEYRLSHWAQIMRERSESGLSIKTYCEQAGFHTNIYYYWQRKLREAACQELAVKTQASNETSTYHSPQHPGWALYETQKSNPSGDTITIELGQCRARLPVGASHEELVKIFRALMSI